MWIMHTRAGARSNYNNYNTCTLATCLFLAIVCMRLEMSNAVRKLPLVSDGSFDLAPKLHGSLLVGMTHEQLLAQPLNVLVRLELRNTATDHEREEHNQMVGMSADNVVSSAAVMLKFSEQWTLLPAQSSCEESGEKEGCCFPVNPKLFLEVSEKVPKVNMEELSDV